VAKRNPFEDSSEQALWNAKQSRVSWVARKVLVAHKDVAVGESIALLLGFKGFAAIHTVDLSSTRKLIASWEPEALLIDTRLDVETDYAFVRSYTADPANAKRLVLGLSGIFPVDPIDKLREAGFDGHCRRPCPLWRLSDLLCAFFRVALYP
jgi:DNA-binding response OmpR family regulator